MRIVSLFTRMVNALRNKITPFDIQAKKAGVKIGGGNLIYSHFWGSEPYLITIGNHCQITEGVKMFTHGGAHVLRKNDPDFDIFGRVKIGDWVYIGNNAMIMPGVAIGDNVLVAAGSVVTKSIPSGVVAGGNPARVICTIEEFKEKNTKFNVRSKSLSYEEKKKMLEKLDVNYFIKKPFMTI